MKKNTHTYTNFVEKSSNDAAKPAVLTFATALHKINCTSLFWYRFFAGHFKYIFECLCELTWARIFWLYLFRNTNIWPIWRNVNPHNGIQQKGEQRTLIKHHSLNVYTTEYTSKNATIYVNFLLTICAFFLMPAMKNVHRIYLWHVLRDTPSTGSALGDCQLNHVVCRIFCNLSRSPDKCRSKRNHHNKRRVYRVAKILFIAIFISASYHWHDSTVVVLFAS